MGKCDGNDLSWRGKFSWRKGYQTVRQKRRSSKWFETSNPRKWSLSAAAPGWPSKSPFSPVPSWTIFISLKLLSIDRQRKSISPRALVTTGFFHALFLLLSTPVLLSFDLHQMALSPVWWWSYIELSSKCESVVQKMFWTLKPLIFTAKGFKSISLYL